MLNKVKSEMHGGKALSSDAFPDEALLNDYDQGTRMALGQFVAEVVNGDRRIPECAKRGRLVLLSKTTSEKV